MNYKDAIERLTVYFSENKYRQDLVDAKEQFFGEATVVGAEVEEFEYKHRLFFDWYLMTRPLQGVGLTPAELAIDLKEFDIPTDQADLYKNLSQARLGLFEYVKSKKNDHTIKDIFSGKKIVVKDAELEIAAEKGTLFMTHVIEDEANNAFSLGLIFHPNEANRHILAPVKKMKKQKDFDQKDFLLQLTKMYFKFEKYTHVGMEKIYNLDDPMRF